jgi:lipopolysaccharide/colanic/teichoic acid biosynthesis glycosyltransferase
VTTMNYIFEIKNTKLPFPPVDLPKSKRAFDIIVSILLFLLFIPFIFLVIIVFLVEYIFSPSSRGSLFYSEIRISKGKPFWLYKFRIFKFGVSEAYSKENGFVQTKALEQNSQNLTFLGKILKQIYMDELPQIFNVLKGDMTLVGPRPSNEVVTWEDGQKNKFQRYLFVCGLTGPFQSEKGSALKLDQTEVDMKYISFCKNNPGWKILFNDIKILCHTVITVIKAKGI